MFSGLINQTAILESLGWDEEVFNQLTKFIEAQNINFNPTHPTIFLNQVEERFGKQTRDVLETIFKEELENIKKDGRKYEN